MNDGRSKQRRKSEKGEKGSRSREKRTRARAHELFVGGEQRIIVRALCCFFSGKPRGHCKWARVVLLGKAVDLANHRTPKRGLANILISVYRK